MANPETTPNQRLIAVMDRAGVSNKGLARRMREASLRDGLKPIATTHTTIAKYRTGQIRRPEPRTCEVLRRTLSDILGTTLSFDDLGYPAGDRVDPAAADQYPATAAIAVDLVNAVAAADLADAPVAVDARWDPTVPTRVISEHLFLYRSAALEVADAAGTAVADHIRETTATLMELDFQWGGGYVRRLLLTFFREQVVPELRRDHPEPVRRKVFSAAAEAIQQIGWSAYDAGRHGAATRYFIQALKLTEEAADRPMSGRLLANLSHQANFLGRYSDALMFARAAQSSTNGSASAAVEAMYVMMEARCLANLADARGTAAAISRAEQLLHRRNPGHDPAWIGYYDEAEFAGDASHCFRDLRRPEEAARFAGEALAPSTPARTRAFINMVVAAAAVHRGDLDHALTVATSALADGDGLKSARYERYVRDFVQSIDQPGHAGAADFIAQVRQRRPQALLPTA